MTVVQPWYLQKPTEVTIAQVILFFQCTTGLCSSVWVQASQTWRSDRVNACRTPDKMQYVHNYAWSSRIDAPSAAKVINGSYSACTNNILWLITKLLCMAICNVCCSRYLSPNTLIILRANGTVSTCTCNFFFTTPRMHYSKSISIYREGYTLQQLPVKTINKLRYVKTATTRVIDWQVLGKGVLIVGTAMGNYRNRS